MYYMILKTMSSLCFIRGNLYEECCHTSHSSACLWAVIYEYVGCRRNKNFVLPVIKSKWCFDANWIDVLLLLVTFPSVNQISTMYPWCQPKRILDAGNRKNNRRIEKTEILFWSRLKRDKFLMFLDVSHCISHKLITHSLTHYCPAQTLECLDPRSVLDVW